LKTSECWSTCNSIQPDLFIRGTMNEEQLQTILSNPAVSTQHRIRAIQKADSIPVEHLEADLVQSIGKPIAEIEYIDVHRFSVSVLPVTVSQ
jgi:hypothetical protein